MTTTRITSPSGAAPITITATPDGVEVEYNDGSTTTHTANDLIAQVTAAVRPATIQPPFTLYTLSAMPGTSGSPAVPAVHLQEHDLDGGWLDQHTITPQQARDLAAMLTAAAHSAEQVTA